MKRTPLIAGNWKMNTTVSEACSLARAILTGIESADGVEKVICPPFVSLAPLYEILAASPIKLAAQNMYFRPKGAFTGEVSASMIKPFCSYVILGHSERRQIFGESNEIINSKIIAAFEAGLKPILCLGESLEQRKAGKAVDTVTGQLLNCLVNVRQTSELVIAYEPVWAIGTGVNAAIEEVCQIMEALRAALAGMYGTGTGDEIRLLYGGSVTAENTASYLSQPVIDGALVGGASLDSNQFTTIIKLAAAVKNT
ncbi:MAG: triose-phosphate isomerase [Dehalococcoidaceae bacterium]|nr:triose-phosphate isomerase [Dehalococcoidaceae bacterium]